MTFENFVYFVGARKKLAPYGLIPGFVRYEWSVKYNSWFVLDSTEEISLSKRAYVELDDEVFISFKQPYCGCFILDKELGSEYVTTKSFDRKLSETYPWGVRERSAAGLTWENVPGGFHSRLGIPIRNDRTAISPSCWLAHLPSNYADDPETPCAKIKMANVLKDKPETGYRKSELMPTSAPQGSFIRSLQKVFRRNSL